MKTKPMLPFALLTGLILHCACNKNNDAIGSKKDIAIKLQYYRNLLYSNKLNSKDFNLTLNKFEELMRDSIIQSANH
ncbi:MAG: hypothetical protein QM763_10270 [Agriterribacter sp.]